jgi:hypothetical protein
VVGTRFQTRKEGSGRVKACGRSRLGKQSLPEWKELSSFLMVD